MDMNQFYMGPQSFKSFSNLLRRIIPTGVEVTLSHTAWNNDKQIMILINDPDDKKMVFSQAMPENMDLAKQHNVRLTNYNTESITFTCDSIPDADVKFNLLFVVRN